MTTEPGNFVLMGVTADEGGNADFQAYQLTPQCLEMVAEDALVVMPEKPAPQIRMLRIAKPK